MTKIFTVPFAENGDKISPPDAVQPDGSVSYNLGYGFDYQRDTSLDSGGAPVDPLAKVFPREQHNGILNDITTAIGEMQINGLPIWQSIGSPYPVNALVRYSGSNWRSTAANNSTTPGAALASWVDAGYQPYATDSAPGIIRIATSQEASAGENISTAMSPALVKSVRPTQATETNLGLLKIATLPQVQAGAAIDVAVTPSTLKSVLPTQATETILGLLKVATLPQAQAGTETMSAITPSTLKALFPKRSFSENDYIRIPDVPGGLIIQFGSASLVADGNITTPMPIAFPNFGLVAFVTLNNIAFNTGSDGAVGVTFATKSTLTIRSGVATSSPAFWLAIGY